MGMTVEKSLLVAQSYQRKGKTAQAVEIYEAILKKFPKNKRAKNAIALLAKGGNSAPAPQQIEKLATLFQQGRFPETIMVAIDLLEKHPNTPLIWNILGLSQINSGQLEDAATSFSTAIRLSPNSADLHFNLGNTLKKQAKYPEATSCFLQALKIKSDYPEALNNLGNCLEEQGRIHDAIACFQKALVSLPSSYEVNNNLAKNLLKCGHLSEALTAGSNALLAQPTLSSAHQFQANIFQKLGQLPKALLAYEQAVEFGPTKGQPLAEKIHLQAQIGDWRWVSEFEKQRDFLDTTQDAPHPFLFLTMEDDPARQRLRSERKARDSFLKPSAIRVETPNFPPINPDEKIKVGFFSADFYDHATMRLMAKLFELYDRSKFKFFVYSYGIGTDDDVTNNLKSSVDKFVDVSEISDDNVAKLAREHQLDIAVDLKGYTENTRIGIFSHHAAPIQMSYLGYPGTLGTDFIDYIIADSTVIPDEYREHYSENIIYLPDSYQINDSGRLYSDEGLARSEFGLPDDAFVFCCFNNNYKITPTEFDIWMRLLQRVDNSVLWLLRSSEAFECNLKKEATLRGLDPDRLIFADRAPADQHLARHRLADLFLDTFNVNAHTTASDALWAGLPVVTKAGNQFAARVAASLLNATDMSELVTDNDEDYEALIYDLAVNQSKLQKVRQKLQANRLTHPLFDTALFVRHLEAAFSEAVNHYLISSALQDLVIADLSNRPRR